MSAIAYTQQYGSKWRERLFYQYKLYTDTITRLQSKEHLTLTLFIFVNGFLMVSTVIALGAEVFIKISWLDIPFAVMGSVLSCGFAVYSWHLRRRFHTMYNEIKEIETDLPESLLAFGSPANILVRVLQEVVPWFFLAAYIYIFIIMHVTIPTLL